MSTWTFRHAKDDPPARGQRVIFYSEETDFVHVGCSYDGAWFDEEDRDATGCGALVTGVTLWTAMPEPPMAAPDAIGLPDRRVHARVRD